MGRDDPIHSPLCCPRPEIVWFPFGLVGALLLARRRQFDALYSTSSPETDHLIAAVLKWVTGTPWIADFRDGWTFESTRVGRQQGLRSKVEGRMERMVVRLADRVVTVNEVIARDLRTRYPQWRNKVITITNGFDSDDLIEARAPGAPSDFRIVHTGRLSGVEEVPRSPGSLQRWRIYAAVRSGWLTACELS